MQWSAHESKEQPIRYEFTDPLKNAVFTSPRAATAPSKYNITQDLLQFSESPSDDARPAPALASSSLDLLAKNLNLNSWEGYSTLSKFMFRCKTYCKECASVSWNEKTHHSVAVCVHCSTLEMEGSYPNQTSNAGASPDKMPIAKLPQFRPGSLVSALPPLASLPVVLPGLQELQPIHNAPSSFSKLVSSMKDMSPDAAAFLQEQDAELTGDASLLCSLSRVSLSDFLNAESAGSQKVDPRYFSALSSLLTEETKSQASEDAVACIIGTDFRHCGYPAFDASFTLLGFYFLLGSAVSADVLVSHVLRS